MATDTQSSGAGPIVLGYARNSRSNAKVCAEPADILEMNNEQSIPFGPDQAQYLEAQALALSVAAIRKAQGKQNPGDYAVGSPGWAARDEDFARDVLRILGLE
jgi:hypothetical protein